RDSPEAALLHDYVRKALTALGIRTGAGHSEVILTDRGPVLIDPGARLGGGVLPWVSTKFLGQSHAGLYAESLINPAGLALLEEDYCLHWEQPVRYVSLINRQPGQVRSLAWVDWLSALPTAVAVATGWQVGSEVSATHDLITSPGYVYLVGDCLA